MLNDYNIVSIYVIEFKFLQYNIIIHHIKNYYGLSKYIKLINNTIKLLKRNNTILLYL